MPTIVFANGKPGKPSSKKLQLINFIEDYTFGKHHWCKSRGTQKHIRNLLLRAQMTNGRIHPFQTKARWTMFLTLAKGVHEPYGNIEKNSICFKMRLCSFFEQELRKHLFPHNLVIFLTKCENKTLTPLSIGSLQPLVKIRTQNWDSNCGWQVET